MKHLKTILISMLLIFTLVFSMVACDNDDDKGGSGTEALTGDGTGASELASGTGDGTGDGSEEGSEKKTDKATESETVKQPVYKNRTVTLTGGNAKKVKKIGRTEQSTTGINCDWTASGIAFKAVMKGDVTVTVDVVDQTSYFTVYVDGDRLPTRYSAAVGTDKTFKIPVGGTSEKLHEIKIVSQSEMQRNRLTIKKLAYFGEALEDAPANKSKYIEFIGDSITCGYGNYNYQSAGDAAGNTAYQDGTQTYAYLAAEELGTDHSMISYSGIGIVRGFSNYGTATNYMRMRDIFKYTSYKRSTTALYDFSTARKPDLVVINLGTNDNAKGTPEAEYKAGVKDLINTVRDCYGDDDLKIVWAYGMMLPDGNNYNNWTLAAISEMGGESAGVYTVKLTYNNQGGHGHPVIDAHETSAETLIDFITSKNLLK